MFTFMCVRWRMGDSINRKMDTCAGTWKSKFVKNLTKILAQFRARSCNKWQGRKKQKYNKFPDKSTHNFPVKLAHLTSALKKLTPASNNSIALKHGSLTNDSRSDLTLANT